MGKALIITEKPSVARDFARVLGVSGRKEGYLENDNYVISWCVGHLVSLVYPEDYDEKYKKWRLEDLPFLPKEYKYDVIKDVKGQYDVVHTLLFREDIDVVYWAGDAGKEGQTIEENIRNFGGVRKGMKELRVWIDSQTDEELLRGIKEARPMEEYANLGKSGIMRTIEDYAMGINFSRVMSIKYGSLLNRCAGTSSYTAIAVGRVMTCVLGMVVIREREIRNFKETPFYRIVGVFSEHRVEAEWKSVDGSKYYESPLLYKENGFKEKADAEALILDLTGKRARILELEKGVNKKRAPLLFNLAELQAECSKRFKISPDETLEIAQALYERKLTTYPRTDARVLTKAVAKEIARNISRLKTMDGMQDYVNHIMKSRSYESIAKTMYTDDSKVTDHYAIIPTGQLTELGSLTDLQRQVFELIVRRFLAIFYPPAEYATVKLTVSIESEHFFTSAKKLTKKGFLEVLGRQNKLDDNDEDEEEGANQTRLFQMAETCQVLDELDVEGFLIREGKTSPPKRYTSGSMVLAMENAGQLIEDEELRAQIKGSGIGTSATRADIIKKLVRIGYLNLNRKTQILTPEKLGEMIYEVVYLTVPALLNPKMTASWEKGLDGITNGTVEFTGYREKLEDFIRKETLSMIETELIQEITDRIVAFTDVENHSKVPRAKIGVSCPMCQGQLVTTPFGYGCENYNKEGDGCGFCIGTIAGKNLSIPEVKMLIENGKTEVIKGFVSKSGKKFDACLRMETKEDMRPEISFDFEQTENKTLPEVVCPDCGGKLQILPFGYRCEHAKEEDGCKFTLGTIAGKKLSTKQVTDLLKNGKTELIEGFESKNGKKFAAVLRLDLSEDGKHQATFDFEDKEAYLIDELICPACGSKMQKTAFGFGCSAYDAQDETSCKFSVGSICGKTLSQEQVKQLLLEKHTDTIRGFKSKSGKRFDACLTLHKKEDGGYAIEFDFEHVKAKVIKGVSCPKCGGEIQVTPFGYGCANYKKNEENSCNFSIGKIAGIKLKETYVKELLSEGRTEVISGFKSKSGKKFDAVLVLEDGDVKFEFPDAVAPVESMIPCPECDYKLIRTKYQYECACGFKISHVVAQNDLSEAVIMELLEKGVTEHAIQGFHSKTNSLFEAKLKYDKESGISFVFD